MALLNQKAFERKLQNMSSTQDSIQTVSLWMIHHKKHAGDMVALWLEQLRKAPKVDRRLILFYLANDVLQNSRKKGKEFCLAFTKILREAMQLLSDKSIKGNIERVIKIWEERKLFEKEYLEALRSKLDSGGVPVPVPVPVPSKKPKEKPEEKEKEVRPPPKQKRLPPADFKPSKLIEALKVLRNFEGELTLKESQLNSLRIDASDLEIVRQLKDRTGGGKFCEEYEGATTKLDEVSEMLRREQQERRDMIQALEDGEAFYDTSYGEVKVIVHAYKTFGNRLTSLKKKVDAKVNKLAQKEAEKAKTGPVTAPQSSFLTSGLPDVAEGSTPSTPTQVKEDKEASGESKPVDPTVDNTEVADMDIEDDSDSEKSVTSEEAVSETKESNNQTPTSTESSDSQQGPMTSKLPDVLEAVPPIANVASAQTPNLGSMVSGQGSLLLSQPAIGAPQQPVGMVLPPYMGAQGIQFPGHHPLQFRPPLQSAQNPAPNAHLQTQSLPGPVKMTGQGPNFSQMPGKTLSMPPHIGMPPNARTQLSGGFGMLSPHMGSSSFVGGQAPLLMALPSLPTPVQTQTGTVPASRLSQKVGKPAHGVADIGSPDSEASAPSPVGSPELHLGEGDETPETTPAPLGDVGINSDTGFPTTKSFLESNLGAGGNAAAALIGYSGPPSSVALEHGLPKSLGSTTSSETTPSPGSTPSTFDQETGRPKKENGQNVSAVDILAQLLSRGRQLQHVGDVDAPVQSAPVATPAPVAPVASPLPVQERSSTSQRKPIMSLIDSLFPKLSDSIKTLKEKEKASNSPQDQHRSPTPEVADIPSSAPARPLPCEGQLQQHSQGTFINEQPIFQESETEDVPRPDQDILLPGQNVHRSGPNDMTRPPINNHDLPHLDGPVRTGFSQHFPGERRFGSPLDMRMEARDGPSHGPISHQHQSIMNHHNIPETHLQGPGGGTSPGFPLDRPMDRPFDMPPHGMQSFGPGVRFPGHQIPQFDQVDNNAVPRQPGEGPPDIPGRVPSEGPDQGHSPRGFFMEGLPRRPGEGPPDMPGRPPLESPSFSHSPRGSFMDGPFFGRHGEGPPGMPGRGIPEGLPQGHSPRGSFLGGQPQRPGQGPPDMAGPVLSEGPPQRLHELPQDIHGQVPLDGPPQGHSPRGRFMDGPSRRLGPPDMAGSVLSEGPPGRPHEGRPDIMHGRVPSDSATRRQSERPPDMPGQLPFNGPPQGHSPRGSFVDGPPRRPGEGPPDMHGRVPLDGPPQRHSPRGGSFVDGPLRRPGAGPPDMAGPVLSEGPPQRPHDGPPDMHRRVPSDGPPQGHSPRGSFMDGPPRRPHEGPPDMVRPVPSEGPPRRLHEGPPDMRGRVPADDPPQGHSPRGSFVDGPPGHSGTTNPSSMTTIEGRRPSDPPGGPPGVRRLSNERGPPGNRRPSNEAGPPHRPDAGPPRQSPHPYPGDDTPQAHRGPYPVAMDAPEHRREFERRMEPRGDHGRGPWDFPRDRPGPPPYGHPERRGPRGPPGASPNRVDFRDDDPSMWTSFDSPGRSPSRNMDLTNVAHEGYREGPPDGSRYHEYGPPERRRHSFGDFENEHMRHAGPPLKRPGPPPVSFGGPPKRPYY